MSDGYFECATCRVASCIPYRRNIDRDELRAAAVKQGWQLLDNNGGLQCGGCEQKARPIIPDRFQSESRCEATCWPLCLCGFADDPVAKNIIKIVRDRLLLGRKRHGNWNDDRSMKREAMEEVADAMIYAARELLGTEGEWKLAKE